MLQRNGEPKINARDKCVGTITVLQHGLPLRMTSYNTFYCSTDAIDAEYPQTHFITPDFFSLKSKAAFVELFSDLWKKTVRNDANFIRQLCYLKAVFNACTAFSCA